jgi:hypothetical protein
MRSRIGRAAWVDRAAAMMIQANSSCDGIQELAARRCGDLFDRAPEGDLAAFFAQDIPHVMLAAFRLQPSGKQGHTTAPRSEFTATGGLVTEESTSMEHPCLSDVKRTMSVGVRGQRINYFVDFSGRSGDTEVWFGGSTDQPHLAGQFAVEGENLFMTVELIPTCRRAATT